MRRYLWTGLLIGVAVPLASHVNAGEPPAKQVPRDVSDKIEEQTGLLLDAAKKGTLEEVRRLLEMGADVNVRDEEGRTPLHHVASGKDSEKVKVLLAHGAKVDARANWSTGPDYRRYETPLHAAARSGCKETAEILLAHGAEIEARNTFGQTPLHVASSGKDSGNVNVLLAHGAKVDVRDDRFGDTPLQTAIRSGCKEIVEILLAHGANVEARNNLRETPLHLAAGSPHKEFAKLLIDRGAVVNVRDSVDGCTPLHLAAGNLSGAEVVRLLLESGADLRVQDSYGWTPLHVAAETGPAESVETLLKHGAEANAETKLGSTPLHRASAAKQGDPKKKADLLLEHGARVGDREDLWGQTPLHIAADHLEVQVAQGLLAHGADVNARDKLGATPMGLAERKKATEAEKQPFIELLMKHGAKE